ncbi:hypothetical protein I552_4054 [Mycobacterium xenopi 3993]|nr:hypothetical protein I552_4054 [Mycobacterium xenopi 3993]
MHRFGGDVGAVIQNDTATPRWALRSAVADSIRDPVNRQITTTPARPSATLPSAQPVRATDPAAKPCHSPTAASMARKTRLTHARARAAPAARSHPASAANTAGAFCADAAQHASSSNSPGPLAGPEFVTKYLTGCIWPFYGRGRKASTTATLADPTKYAGAGFQLSAPGSILDAAGRLVLPRAG